MQTLTLIRLSVQMLLSSSTDLTLEMCTPNERCTPEQLIQSITQRLTEAQTGSGEGEGKGFVTNY